MCKEGKGTVCRGVPSQCRMAGRAGVGVAGPRSSSEDPPQEIVLERGFVEASPCLGVTAILGNLGGEGGAPQLGADPCFSAAQCHTRSLCSAHRRHRREGLGTAVLVRALGRECRIKKECSFNICLSASQDFHLICLSESQQRTLSQIHKKGSYVFIESGRTDSSLLLINSLMTIVLLIKVNIASETNNNTTALG